MGRKKIGTTIYITHAQRAAIAKIVELERVSFSELYREAMDHVIARHVRAQTPTLPLFGEIGDEAEQAIDATLTLHPKVVRFARAVVGLNERLNATTRMLDIERARANRATDRLMVMKKRVGDALEERVTR